jgi:hypothetical protein
MRIAGKWVIEFNAMALMTPGLITVISFGDIVAGSENFQ